ncbi:isochorismatase family cysteine hydrolase [Rhizohabitans arisaemae]|uniref:isochorismatase family cysteine hydrolase n=1 Tax=Rhizohabitans arisaemae TaxID=2720610 RepID=UPI0024B122AB|nr:isochorismatase family cysteine hydrolase [Rhizohabitans arisaemae]
MSQAQAPQTERIDPRSSALIVVDMQNGFCHPDGTVAQAGPVDAHRAVIAPVARLAQACHEAGIPVFWSLQEHFEGDVSIDRSRLDNPQARLPQPPCLRGTWDAELVDELRDLAHGDVHIVKHRASAFYGTGLEVELRMRGVRTVVVTGVSTSYCVDATIRDAYARDLGVIVVEDACASPWPDLHAATMKNAAIFHGTVTNTAHVLGMIAAGKGPQ